MATLSFLPPIGANQRVVQDEDWGTGKKRTGDDLKLPKGATFVLRDIPIRQYYDLTNLRRSNLRTDDQLVPRPEACDMGAKVINKTFPAEHPHSSHTVQKAIFPKFTECPDDPLRGYEARRFLPKPFQVPAQPAEVTVVTKTKGHGYRHEIEKRPAGESLKQPLRWPGEYGFDQKVKIHGGRPQYYPAPTKTYIPNMEKRRPEMQISEKTANTLQNIEREQWKTTYDLNNTGYGRSNALELDNWDQKVDKFNTTGELDENLYPRSVPVFDPSRPVEGRMARYFTPGPAALVTPSDWRARQQDEPRPLTQNEIEELRLLCGKEYINLPEGKELDYVYQDYVQPTYRHLPYFITHSEVVKVDDEKVADEEAENCTDDSKIRRKFEIQQMEAANRWRDLENSKPNHDLEALQNKYKSLKGREHVDVFYDHEGRYQEQRAGMYKTSYDPQKLTQSMKRYNERDLLDTSQSHVDAINHPTTLNAEMDAAMAFSEIRHLNIPVGSGRQQPSQVLQPLLTQKANQEVYLQPDVINSRPGVQENGLINKESEYQDQFNDVKFLQENDLHPLARSEPNIVMSYQNQRLDNVRPSASLKRSKTVQFSNNVTVATGAGNEPIRISSAPMNGEGGNQQCQSYQLGQNNYQPQNRHSTMPSATYLNGANTKTESENVHYFPIRELDPRHRYSTNSVNKTSSYIPLKRYQSDQANLFSSKSTNFMPTGIQNHSMSSSYQSQFPTSYSLDFKDDPRFRWQPGMGPKPQSLLRDIQTSFSKANVIKEFNRRFPELNGDIRKSTTTGRRHVFDGVHAQTFRGSALS